jgi:hypothetical protein
MLPELSMTTMMSTGSRSSAACACCVAQAPPLPLPAVGVTSMLRLPACAAGPAELAGPPLASALAPPLGLAIAGELGLPDSEVPEHALSKAATANRAPQRQTKLLRMGC